MPAAELALRFICESGEMDGASETDMKHPKSPNCMNSSSPPREEEEEGIDGEEKRVAAGRRAKRERRQSSSSATVCQVCNIRLNSSAQAQIHYRGKTHQRSLRRLAKAVSTGALSQNQVHPLLGSFRLPGRPLQPQSLAHLDHFLPLRVNSSSPLSLFPNFNAMDPVQKAVINHTFGVTPPKKKPIISCNICHLRFNSTNQAEAHYKGHKHARKLKALENQKSRQKNRNGHPTPGKERERARGGAVPTDSHLKEGSGPRTSSLPENVQWRSSGPSSSDCSSLCSPQPAPHTSADPQQSVAPAVGSSVEGGVATTGSAPDLDPQQSVAGGSNHKQMLSGPNQSQSMVKMASLSRPAYRVKQRMGNKTNTVVGVSNQPFHCEMCQVSVNSETQLKQHMNSRRHKERLAGRPVKLKFTPYNKLQPSAILAAKLVLQKQLSKALSAGFLTSPLNPAALCALASGPLPLRLPPGHPAIIQGPLLSPTLFRPAPGPLRATHGPIIFSPY